MTRREQPYRQRTMSDKESVSTSAPEAVTCLGITFQSDEERRKYSLGKLREKLQDPEFRKIEGFPIGSDEDILALSDPPYYTACPNPFVAAFVKHYGKPYDPSKQYSREPFAVDVSEGKTDPIYKAHSYHTKVPHLAILPSILHYTEPGDVVLDGFCGSGMTGVAAQWCGTAPAEYRFSVEANWEKQGLDKPKWGSRRVVLNDLAPAAAQVQRRVREQYGERETVSRAARRVLRSFLDWGVLEETGKKGIYRLGSVSTVTDPRVVAWLVEACLRMRAATSAELSDVLESTCLFPFQITRVAADQLVGASTYLDVLRHGLDQQLVLLREAD